jgi:hypothetical protein
LGSEGGLDKNHVMVHCTVKIEAFFSLGKLQYSQSLNVHLPILLLVDGILVA